MLVFHKLADAIKSSVRHSIQRSTCLETAISLVRPKVKMSVVMDCRVAALLSMNNPVIANEVTQSMHPEVMDRRATLAMTRSLFKVRVRYRVDSAGSQ